MAAFGIGGVHHIEVDGFDITGPITLPKSGRWPTWQTFVSSGMVDGRVASDAAGLDTRTTQRVLRQPERQTVGSSGANTPPALSLRPLANGVTYSTSATIPLRATASDTEAS